MYQFHFDEKDGLLEATLSGFWTHETVKAFGQDLARMAKQYSGKFPHFPSLFDSRTLSLLSTEVSEAFGAAAQDPSSHRSRVAIVVETAFKKMQAQRLLNEREPHFFNDLAEHFHVER